MDAIETCVAYNEATRKYEHTVYKKLQYPSYAVYACAMCRSGGGVASFQELALHYDQKHHLQLLPITIDVETKSTTEDQVPSLRVSMRVMPDCCLCLDKIEKFGICLPCGHAGFCYTCIHTLRSCPMCRGAIESIHRVYFN